jgi:hypothetical protein
MSKYPDPVKFKPKNIDKYVGDHTNIISRSSWETKFMIWADRNSNIIKWSSEEIIIPYKSPLDGKTHRYFVDFKIDVMTNSGIKTYIVEIKPYNQTVEPIIPVKKTKRFLTECKTYAINTAKWEAANRYANDRNWGFKILTERDLF